MKAIIGILFAIGGANAMAGGGTSVGGGSPAAELCVEKGGEALITEYADGAQGGICRLKDGSVVDDWAIFRSIGPDGKIERAIRLFLDSDSARELGLKKKIRSKYPAREWGGRYCKAKHGKVVAVRESPAGRRLEICEFRDRSGIEVRTLFGGPAKFDALAALFR